MKFFYDPINDCEWQSNSPEAGWIRITKEKTDELTAARSSGNRIYVDGSNTPKVWVTPTKPELLWNETAMLSNFSVLGGEPAQSWIIQKLPVETQGQLLGEQRWIHQTSAFVYKLVDGSWGVDYAESVPTDAEMTFPTDVLTLNVLSSIHVDFVNGMTGNRLWKRGNIDYLVIPISTLAEAYRKAQDHWQRCFDLEGEYGSKIVAGQFVDIYHWPTK